MTDNKRFREELSLAMAKRYVELESLIPELGSVENVIRADYESRYGTDGLDEVINSFIAELASFDQRLDAALATPDYIRANLEGIMSEHTMNATQRVAFLTAVKDYQCAAGTAGLARALSGKDESALAMLLEHTAAPAASVDSTSDADALLQCVIDLSDAAAVAPSTEQVEHAIQDLDDANPAAQPERDQNLLCCYAAYVALRDNEVPGVTLNQDGTAFIADTIKAGQTEAKVMRDLSEGRLNSQDAVNILHAVADVMLVSTSILISVSAGAAAAIGTMTLIQLITGASGALLGIMIAVELVAGVVIGVKTAGAALDVCADFGDWLEAHVIEPGFDKLAVHIDDFAQWFDTTLKPAVQKTWAEVSRNVGNAWNEASKGINAAWDNISKSTAAVCDNIRQGIQPAAQQAFAGMASAANSTADWLEKTVQPATERAAENISRQTQSAAQSFEKWVDDNPGGINIDEKLGNLTGHVVSAVSSVVDWIAGNHDKVDEAITNAAESTRQAVAESNHWADKQHNEFDRDLDAFAETAHTAAEHGADWLNANQPDLENKLGDAVDSAADALDTAGKTMSEWAENVARSADENCDSMADEIDRKLGDAMQTGSEWLHENEPQIRTTIHKVADVSQTAVKKTADWIKDVQPDIRDTVNKTAQSAAEGVHKAGEWINDNKPQIDATIDKAAQGIRQAADTVHDWAKQNRPQIDEAVNKGAKAFQKFGSAAIDWLQKQAEQIDKSVGNVLDSTPTTREPSTPTDAATHAHETAQASSSSTPTESGASATAQRSAPSTTDDHDQHAPDSQPRN